MYFFKFLKYYWEEKLPDPADRVLVPLFTFMIGSLPFLIISVVFNLPWIIGTYATIAGVIIFCLLLTVMFQYYRKIYLEWQDEVFDTLRKEPKNYTDE